VKESATASLGRPSTPVRPIAMHRSSSTTFVLIGPCRPLRNKTKHNSKLLPRTMVQTALPGERELTGCRDETRE
jgi:hypothetical protein